MKKSRMIRKIGSVLFLLMIVAVLSGKNSYAKENNTYLDVGTYADTENGYSYPGVAFYMDGVIQHYAMDIWKKTQEQWSYCHTRVNDRVFTNSDNTEVVKDIRMKTKMKMAVTVLHFLIMQSRLQMNILYWSKECRQGKKEKK